AGQHVGYVNGKLENTIPGAIVESSTANEDWSEAIEPDYLVPDGVQYTITLDGSSMTQQDPQEDFGLIAPGYDLEIDNLSLNPGEKDMLSVSRNGTKASFTSSAQQAPVAYYGVSDSTSDYTFALSGDDIPANGTISFDLPINGTGFTFSTSNTGNATNSVSIGVDKEDDSGSHQFESDGIALSDGDTATLEFGSWSPGQSMRLEATQGGQKRSEDLPDQAGSGGAALFNSGSSGNSGNSGSSGGSGNS
ncbi:MAG TPA: hypothetical protein VGR90_06270, partial [Acidimicrobiales bacterium]|nr:hypothetical protein [Acidimicrobiales bacterium]